MFNKNVKHPNEIKSMTHQEAFDSVVKFAFTQGKHSSAKDGGCMYRNPDGLCCFIGAFIPDDIYHIDMENKIIDVVIMNPYVSRALELSDGENDDYKISFWGYLQDIHDNHLVSEWPRKFKDLADEFNLIYRGVK